MQKQKRETDINLNNTVTHSFGHTAQNYLTDVVSDTVGDC